ncbi:MAG: choice-of-anchor Q domain-containing protein [Planctomycetota bacterium]
MADGTYTPDGASPGNRALAFALPTGVEIYGGFAGTETLRIQRNWITNATILSGDLNGDDVGFTNNTENSYHVVTAKGVTGTLDGFTVSGGNANGLSTASLGGGMYNSYSAVVTLANCTFTGNSANGGGGGMYNQAIPASSTITDCLFIGNRTNGSGGGLMNKSSNVTITGSVFSENTGVNGAGLYNSTSSPTIINSVFSRNASSYTGGAVYNSLSSPAFMNSTFFENSASVFGGAMYNVGASSPTLTNCILWGDTSVNLGKEIRNASGAAPLISFSDIQGSGGSGAGWNVSLGTDGGGNIGGDPLFMNPLDPDGADNVFRTTDDGLRLSTVSPALDSGTGAGAPGTDILGIARPLGAGYDMGAYECVSTGIFVDWSAAGANNGTSWNDAYTDLQTALANAASGDEIWVADGTYTPDGAVPGSRTLSFQLRDGVSVYGGFAGTETLRSQRDWVTNVTILSGDLNGDDVGFTNNTENSYHVVTARTVTATLDGFTISGGNANGGFAADLGGGMYNSYSAVVTVANCTLSWNSAQVAGGGMYNYLVSASSTVTDCLFIGNRTNGSGGGLTNKSSNVTIANSVFSQNTAVNGAAVYNSTSSPAFTNIVFTQNTGTMAGGGMYNSVSSPTLMNCTFFQNAGGLYGGAVYNTGTSNATVTNCILWGDTATSLGNEIRNASGGAATIRFSDIQGSGGSGAGWNASLGSDGGGNINADPMFVNPADPDGADNRFATSDDGLLVDKISPAIDSGTAAGAPATDLIGVLRPLGGGYDLGAYECIATGIFVDWSASGANNGTSWADAYTDLQTALANAVSGDEIWVATGTYTPDGAVPGSRTLSFQLRDGVAVYGGFAGTEMVRTQRNWITNVTILSGDLNGDDVGFTNNTENSYHVVTAKTVTAMLDGFTISGGNANGGFAADLGGGMYNSYSAVVTVANCTFTWNSASVTGGGMYNYLVSASATVTDCLFIGNRTNGSGGGLSNKTSNLTITKSVFSANTAANGAAVYNSTSTPTFTNSLFIRNTSTMAGGGMYNSGSSPTLTNCTFFENVGGLYGGAAYNAGTSNATLTNCILWGDTATSLGNEIRNASGGAATISFSDIQGSGGSGAGWNASLGADGGGNVDANPIFLKASDPDGADNRYATADDGLRLNAISPAIDSGTAAGAPPIDLIGVSRPRGAGYDMGAYESLSTKIYVDVNATGTNNGTSWANAYTDMQTALSHAVAGDQIWVADGSYTPDGASPGNRTLSFRLPDGVVLYGGFAGNETLLSQRNWVTHVTTLSGDLNRDDVGFTNNTENSYHVVTVQGGTIVLDGFTITGGNANGGSTASVGGGMYSSYSAVVMVANCTFSWNSAAASGGGMYSQSISASSSVVDSIFIHNTTAGSGGGMSNKNSNLRVSNSVFSQNAAANGGGIYNSTSSPTISNCIFIQNTATMAGGGVHNSGSSPLLANCTFFENASNFYGGAMYNVGASNPTVTNCILWGDTSVNVGKEIRNASGGTATIRFSDIQGSGGSGAGWNASLGIDGGGNIDSDPLFSNSSDPEGPDNRWATDDDGLRQLYTSPVFDTGAAAGAPSDDITGMSRPQGAGFDMGAYELEVVTAILGPGDTYVYTDSDGDTVTAAYDPASTGTVALYLRKMGLGEDIMSIVYAGATASSYLDISITNVVGNGATTAGKVTATGQVFGTFILDGWIESWTGGELATGETISTIPGGALGNVGDMTFENALSGSLVIGNDATGVITIGAAGVAPTGSITVLGDLTTFVSDGAVLGAMFVQSDLGGFTVNSGAFNAPLSVLGHAGSIYLYGGSGANGDITIGNGLDHFESHGDSAGALRVLAGGAQEIYFYDGGVTGDVVVTGNVTTLQVQNAYWRDMDSTDIYAIHVFGNVSSLRFEGYTGPEPLVMDGDILVEGGTITDFYIEGGDFQGILVGTAGIGSAVYNTPNGVLQMIYSGGPMGTLNVMNGSIGAAVQVLGDVGSIYTKQGVTPAGSIMIQGGLTTFVSDGAVLGAVWVQNDLGSFTINSGALNAFLTVTGHAGNIYLYGGSGANGDIMVNNGLDHFESHGASAGALIVTAGGAPEIYFYDGSVTGDVVVYGNVTTLQVQNAYWRDMDSTDIYAIHVFGNVSSLRFEGYTGPEPLVMDGDILVEGGTITDFYIEGGDFQGILVGMAGIGTATYATPTGVLEQIFCGGPMTTLNVVNGAIGAAVQVLGDVGSIYTKQGVTPAGSIMIQGGLTTFVSDGAVLGAVWVQNDLGSFTINSGALNAFLTVTGHAGNIYLYGGSGANGDIMVNNGLDHFESHGASAGALIVTAGGAPEIYFYDGSVTGDVVVYGNVTTLQVQNAYWRDMDSTDIYAIHVFGNVSSLRFEGYTGPEPLVMDGDILVEGGTITDFYIEGGDFQGILVGMAGIGTATYATPNGVLEQIFSGGALGLLDVLNGPINAMVQVNGNTAEIDARAGVGTAGQLSLNGDVTYFYCEGDMAGTLIAQKVSGTVWITGDLLTVGGGVSIVVNNELRGTIHVTGDASTADMIWIGSVAVTGQLYAGQFGNVTVAGDFRGTVGGVATVNGVGNTLTLTSTGHTINGTVYRSGAPVAVTGEVLGFNGAFVDIDDTATP